MSIGRFKYFSHIACCLAASVSLSVITTNRAAAQQPSRPPGSPDPKAEQRKREVRESVLRTTEMRVAIESRDQKRIDAAVEQVKQDYKHIQIVRNEIARNLLANKQADYKIISRESAEINKRAERLKKYLVPTTSEEKENQKNQVEFNNEQMKGALVRLCNLIDSFTENPALKAPDSAEVKQLIKVGADLTSIIELSGDIKRNAERLSKPSK